MHQAHSWWWAQAAPSLDWLQTAAELGVFRGMTDLEGESLAAAMKILKPTTVWLAALIHQGGYDGRHGGLIELCKSDINDGAADFISSAHPTSVSPLVECAAKAQLRPLMATTQRRTRRTRIRQRGRAGGVVLLEVVELSNYLSEISVMEATPTDWCNRLQKIARVWGDGWVLRQAIASAPADLDLPSVVDCPGFEDDPVLVAGVLLEEQARSHSNDVQWWQQSHASSNSDLELRHWAFSVLRIARPHVVLDLTPQLNDVVGAISPKHYVALRYALEHFRKG